MMIGMIIGIQTQKPHNLLCKNFTHPDCRIVFDSCKIYEKMVSFPNINLKSKEGIPMFSISLDRCKVKENEGCVNILSLNLSESRITRRTRKGFLDHYMTLIGNKEAQSGNMCYNWHNLTECLLLVKVLNV